MAVSLTFTDSTGAAQVLGGMTAYEASQLWHLMWRQLGYVAKPGWSLSGPSNPDAYPGRAGSFEIATAALAAIRAPGYVPLSPQSR